MKHLLLSLCAALMFAGSLQADVISFSNLDQDFDASNQLNVGGETAGFTITGSDSSGVLTYSVSYTADFGTGTGVETLSFDVVVQGFENATENLYVGDGNVAGNTVDFGAGSTLVDVNPNADNSTWRVASGNNGANDPDRFDRDETLVFDLVNLSITGANDADFLGFDAVRYQETAGSQHQALVGIGTGVLGQQFNNNQNLTFPLAQTLYVSGDANAVSSGINFGVNNVGFDIHVKAEAVPEPMGMLGDVDLNGVVNFLDIAPFIDLLSSQTFQFEADIDGNMVVNFFDIAPFIAILSGQ